MDRWPNGSRLVGDYAEGAEDWLEASGGSMSSLGGWLGTEIGR